MDAVVEIVNPVVADGADPWVVRHEGGYLYCYADGGIILAASPELKGIGASRGAEIWRPPESGPYSRNVWAPELHRFGGRWYVYFAADDGDNRNHRMYVLESGWGDPFGPYRMVGEIGDGSGRWAIDGSAFEWGGKRYFVWSGWEGEENVAQNLYIAEMASPVALAGERVLISRPEHAWEKAGGPPWVNEGPQALAGGGRLHLVYSAGASWTDHYCLGRLTLRGSDPLDPGAWEKHPEPVFAGAGGVIAPGHASFVEASELGGWYVVYHAAKRPGAGWDREVRVKRFGWDADGMPVFGVPE